MDSKSPFSSLDTCRELLESGVTRTFDSLISLYNRSGRAIDRTILEHELTKLYQELGKRAAAALASPEASLGAGDPDVRTLLDNISECKARIAACSGGPEKKEENNEKPS